MSEYERLRGLARLRGMHKYRGRVDEWISRCTLPEISVLAAAGRFYVKPDIEPFSGLAVPPAPGGGRKTGSGTMPGGREPPVWLAAHVRERLLGIAAEWRDQLERESDGRPFRVFAWLKEIHPMESQVVCEFGDSVGFYDKTFERRVEGRQPSFHINGFTETEKSGSTDFFTMREGNPGDSVVGSRRTFSWTCWLECSYLYKKLDGLGDIEMEKLVRKGAVRSETGPAGDPAGAREAVPSAAVDTCFALSRDRVWVVRPLPQSGTVPSP